MKIDALFPYLLADVPGAPDVLATQALLLTAIDFCTRTLAWDEIQDPIPLEDDVGTYDVYAPTSARVVTIKSISAFDRALHPVAMSELQLYVPNWQTAKSSQPIYYSAPDDLSTVRLFPIPYGSNGAQVTIRAAYTPILGATTVPDAIVNRYLDAIISGAKARLMASPGKSWSNPQLSVFHRQEYEDGVVRAMADVAHDKVQGSVNVKPRRFGW